MVRNQRRSARRALPRIRTISVLLTTVSLAVTGACREPAETVVVYCSIDEPFARRVIQAFEERTGLRPQVVFDSEAGKTTGLINRIRAEKGRPRADVLFSSELFNTMQLAAEGLLEAYDPPTAADIPAEFRDAQHRWTAIGLRGRVLAFDPRRIKADELPDTWEEIAQPSWVSQLALANPAFGTTRGHVAAMFALWRTERATSFLHRLKEGGALVVDSNSAALRAVVNGRAAICLTDTDDVWVARRDGATLDLKYPDMGDGGTLWIPSSVAILAGAPHPANARKLVDFLVSPRVEAMLAESASRNVPVRPSLRSAMNIESPPRSRVAYQDVAAVMDESAGLAREILLK